MKDVFDELFLLNPKVSTSVAFLLGLLLVGDLTTSEQNLVGNWIILVGQTILTNASSQNAIESRLHNSFNINSHEVKSLYNPISYDLNNLKNIFNKFNSNEIDIIYKMIKDLEYKLNQIKK